ncbi:MAG TPA: hypothetical protein VM598_09840, partial [Bdellovibrionota bacterium]|nr:hypothetical protein [Bdellovibrionota bacterium]
MAKPKKKSVVAASRELIAGTLFVVAILVGATALLWNHLLAGYTKSRYLSESPEPALLRHLSEMEADRAALARYPIFAPSRGKSDASKFMASLLKGKRLKLPASVELQLQGPDWPNAKVDWS